MTSNDAQHHTNPEHSHNFKKINKNKKFNQNLSFTNAQAHSHHGSHTKKRTQKKYASFTNLHGDPLGSKEDSTVRLVFENFNGLAAWKP